MLEDGSVLAFGEAEAMGALIFKSIARLDSSNCLPANDPLGGTPFYFLHCLTAPFALSFSLMNTTDQREGFLMKSLCCPFLFLLLFFLAIPLRAEDDSGGWSDSGETDGITCEISCHVESSTTIHEHENRAGSTSSIETHHAVTDSEGTKFENNANETKFADGHWEVRDTSTSTTKYGDQTAETRSSV